MPDVVAPPPRHPRFALLDGMRAIAVMCVVWVHAALMGGAFSASLFGRLLAHLNIGVTIFFLISGFLLYRPMIAGRSGGAPAPSVQDYAKRRFLRIYPAYWVAVTVLVLVPGVTVVVAGNWWPMYALLHTLPVYSGGRCVDAVLKCGLAQTWSLVAEVTFYAALPLYAFVLRRLTRRLALRTWMRVELGVLGALSAISVALQFVVLKRVPAWFAGSAAAYVLWFALGMGLAVISVGLRGSEPSRRAALRWLDGRVTILWLGALGAYLVLALSLPASPFLFSRGQRLAVHLVFGGIALLLLAPAVFGERSDALARRVLAHPAMAWLGLVSYGIFLWHYVVALELGPDGAKASFIVVLLGTLAISIACAAASYYLVERPLLRLKYRRLSEILGRSPLSPTVPRALD